MARDGVRKLNEKLTDAEVKLLQASARDSIIEMVDGSRDTKSGYNQNLKLACPHFVIQRSESGQAQRQVSALDEEPKRTEVVKGTIGGKQVEVTKYFYRCSACGAEVPSLIPPASVRSVTLKEVQAENEFILRLAADILRTETLLRVGFDGNLIIPGINADGGSSMLNTGNDLVNLIIKNPGIRLSRFGLISTLYNLAEAAKIMSEGTTMVKKSSNIVDGVALSKKTFEEFSHGRDHMAGRGRRSNISNRELVNYDERDERDRDRRVRDDRDGGSSTGGIKVR